MKKKKAYYSLTMKYAMCYIISRRQKRQIEFIIYSRLILFF